ncbi:MAG: M48 family metallopeptidase [Cyanobacteria bacterium P01_C01_bin.69]
MPIELPPGSAAYSEDTPPANNRQLLTLFLLFLLGLGITIGIASWVASTLVWLLPAKVEQQLGRAIVPAFEAQAQPSATQDVLNTLLDRLETNLPEEQRTWDGEEVRNYQVLYVPDETVNALAIPGDRIIIYKGLLAEVESENELMMVLGHELGHFANRDHLRGLSRSVLVRLSVGAFLGDFGSLGAIASNSISSLSNAQFSQRQEIQADEVGLLLLLREYGHSGGATDFFTRLAAQEEQRRGLAILASHPPSDARVRHIETLSKKSFNRETVPLPDEIIQAVGRTTVGD